jgi:hypothetical protein
MASDPSNQELLDRLVKLESKLLHRLMRLEAENARQRAQIDDLLKGSDIFRESTRNALTHIYDLLWPVVHKVFPKFSEMQNHIDAVIPPSYADPRADRRRDDQTS